MKKTVAPGAKTPLFDRIFKPELITLENGHTVTRPRSRTPLIALLVFAALAISVHVTGFNLAIIAKRANQLTKILSQIFQPDPSFFSKVITPLLDTIKMSVMGSVIGCLLALMYEWYGTIAAPMLFHSVANLFVYVMLELLPFGGVFLSVPSCVLFLVLSAGSLFLLWMLQGKTALRQKG